MRKLVVAGLVAAVCAAPAAYSQAFLEEEFTEDDFAQFFSLIEDGKISKEKMSERCQKQAIGFTFAGENVLHTGDPERIFYNVSREDTSVDGRTLRAKHYNASFGEWTGAVFKPLCPGIYSITVDFSTSDIDDLNASEEVAVNVFLKRANEERPGQLIATAVKSSPGTRGTGHATVALPLHSGDEISTYSEAAGDSKARNLASITLTAYKVMHLEDYVAEINMDEWSKEVVALKSSNR